MKQEKWFDRKFNFENTQNIFPSILERLSGTPARLDEKLLGVPEEVLTFSSGNTWTIKQNVGHLIDLEPLWQGRLADIINGEPELRPTDLQNNKTHLANHNEKSLNELLSGFREIRQQTMRALWAIDEATIFKFALHPRLKTPMRTMDLFTFVAEHDDHHLATITALLTANRNDSK